MRHDGVMRSKTLAWTLAGLVALALAGGLGLALRGNDPEPAASAESQTPSAPTTQEQPERDVESVAAPAEASPTTTGTQPTATTTPPVAPTTAPTTTLNESVTGYTPIPKPVMGPLTVAPGGALTKHLAEDIAHAFGFDPDEVAAAIDSVVLPPEAGGQPEGWLAPGTYPELVTASELVQAMVDRRIAQLEERSVARDRWHRVVTAASVIEKETYNQTEKPAVARVLSNRLDGGGPLQMDSIILYPVSEDRIFTTSDERASDQPYNSYQHDGLPPTPICSPDEAAIDAFLAPPPGDWWFYVTIDLDSGETRYAVTYDEHLTNVDLLREWLDDNPTS